MSTLVSVVVPVYNEEENVAPLAAQVEAVFQDLPGCEYECLFVNDGSTDGTGEQVARAAAANPRFRPVHHPRNLGQSAALLTGMRRARGEYILTLDGDLQNDPRDFPQVLRLLEEYDCVCGYRADRHDHWARVAVSKAANRVFRSFLGASVGDTGCGIKGFRRVCVQHIVPFRGVHRFFPVLMQNAGLTVGECAVAHYPRVHGASKYSIGNRLWRVLYDLIGVRWLQHRYIVLPEDDADQPQRLAEGRPGAVAATLAEGGAAEAAPATAVLSKEAHMAHFGVQDPPYAG